MARLLDDVQNYELMFIVSPELGEIGISKKIEEVKTAVKSAGGKVTHEDSWGLRDMTYRIKKQERGFYVVLNFTLENRTELVELDKTLRLDPGVLRHMIVKTPVGYEFKTLKEYEAAAKEEVRLAEKAEIEKEREEEKKVVKKAVTKAAKPIHKVKEEKEEEPVEEEAPVEEKPAKKVKVKEELSDVDEKLRKIMENPDIDL